MTLVISELITRPCEFGWYPSAWMDEEPYDIFDLNAMEEHGKLGFT